jgi:hypothetical protein
MRPGIEKRVGDKSKSATGCCIGWMSTSRVAVWYELSVAHVFGRKILGS